MITHKISSSAVRLSTEKEDVYFQGLLYWLTYAAHLDKRLLVEMNKIISYIVSGLFCFSFPKKRPESNKRQTLQCLK